MEYILQQDNECHWYVIPKDKESDFESWMESEDYEMGISPSWAEEVGGCVSLVSFKDYKIRD